MNTTEAPAQSEEIKLPPTVPTGTFPVGWKAVPIVLPVVDDVTREPKLDAEGKPETFQLPFPRHYHRNFFHRPGTVIVGAPKRGGYWANKELPPLPTREEWEAMPEEQRTALAKSRRRVAQRINECKPSRYIVMGDMSLHRQDNVLRKQFLSMSAQEQSDMITQARARIEQAQQG